AEHFLQRERMRRAERQEDALLRRRRLQLEIEPLAKLLAQSEAPGAVDAAAERRVQHQLHAARFVEEALEDKRFGGRQGPERTLALCEVGGNLLCRFAFQPEAFNQKFHCSIELAVRTARIRP